MANKKPFTWVVAFTVDPTWVADGFTLSDERAHDMLWKELAGSHGTEVGARVIHAPRGSRIAAEQGYYKGHPTHSAEILELRKAAPDAGKLAAAIAYATDVLADVLSGATPRPPAVVVAEALRLLRELRGFAAPDTIPE